jgi:hypothetical protein
MYVWVSGGRVDGRAKLEEWFTCALTSETPGIYTLFRNFYLHMYIELEHEIMLALGQWQWWCNIMYCEIEISYVFSTK